MDDERLHDIACEVIRRLADRLGANGRGGPLITVITGATAGLSTALQQMSRLILDGYRLELAYSAAAQAMLASVIERRLAGLPNVTRLAVDHWPTALKEARAVLVPLMSVNSLAKVTLLMADSLATNLLVHALFMGKPVIIARNGCDPDDPGRRELGFDQGRRVLGDMLRQRLRVLSELGATVTDITGLRDSLEEALAQCEPSNAGDGALPLPAGHSLVPLAARVVTAAHVAHAARSKTGIRVGATSLVTPLARDLAARYGVPLVTDRNL